jgi:hypothetical protein
MEQYARARERLQAYTGHTLATDASQSVRLLGRMTAQDTRLSRASNSGDSVGTKGLING